MSCVSARQMSWLSTRHRSYVPTLRYAQCSQPTQRKPQRGAVEGRLLCVGCEHWAYLGMRLVESQDICLVETQGLRCVESWDMGCNFGGHLGSLWGALGEPLGDSGSTLGSLWGALDTPRALWGSHYTGVSLFMRIGQECGT